MADLPPLPDPNEPFVVPQTGLVNPDWYRWMQALVVFSGEITDEIGGVEGDLASLKIEDMWAHTQAKVANGTYLLGNAPFAGTIDSTTTDCTSGTCSVRWKINGVDVGTTANSVSTTQQQRTHTTANAFEAGDVISYTISSNSACLGALLQANLTRAAS